MADLNDLIKRIARLEAIIDSACLFSESHFACKDKAKPRKAVDRLYQILRLAKVLAAPEPGEPDTEPEERR